MNTLKAATVFLLVLPCQYIYAQARETPYTKHCIYVELLGQGGLYSVNYEHRFSPSLSGRVGFTSWSLPTTFLFQVGKIDVIGFPLMLSYLTGEGNSHLEVGVGGVLGSGRWTATSFWGESVSDGPRTFVVGTATVGYRYQPVHKGFLFRIGATPIFGSSGVRMLGGLSGGYAF